MLFFIILLAYSILLFCIVLVNIMEENEIYDYIKEDVLKKHFENLSDKENTLTLLTIMTFIFFPVLILVPIRNTYLFFMEIFNEWK